MASDGRKEIYSILAERYASAQEHITVSVQDVYAAILALVRNDSNQAKVDCISGFAESYDSMAILSDGLVPAVKKLSQYVISSSRVASINEYLRIKKIKVRAAWAFLSALAGYPINEEFIGFYESGPNSNAVPGMSNPSSFSSSSGPQPFLPIVPTIFTQFGNPYNYSAMHLFNHPLFDYSMVVPYMEWFPDSESTDPASKGAEFADVINVAFFEWIQARPGRPFRWALEPNGYGRALLSRNIPALFQDPADYINGVPGVWSSNGNAKYRAWALQFFAAMKNRLSFYGIPDPIYIDPDYEGGVGGLWIFGTNVQADFHQSYLLYQADPRYDTELFDGVTTLKNFIDNYRDLDGNPVPSDEMFPIRYESSVNGAKRGNIHPSVSCRALDYAMSQILYEPAKTVFPNVLCGNWNYFTAGRASDLRTANYRPKETPVDFNTTMHGDMAVLAYYGPQGPWEIPLPWWTPDLGIRQYYDMTNRYGINTNQSAADQLHDTVIADFSYNVRALSRTAPKQAAVWLSYEDGSGFFSQDVWPPGSVFFSYDRSFVKEQMRICNANGIAYFGTFEVDLFNARSQSLANQVMDFWLHVIQDMPQSGYSIA